MYALPMATKTISVDLEAYERLRAARLQPDESFSMVIKRARWSSARRTAGALLAGLEQVDPLPIEILDELDKHQLADPHPDDPWRSG